MPHKRGERHRRRNAQEMDDEDADQHRTTKREHSMSECGDTDRHGHHEKHRPDNRGSDASGPQLKEHGIGESEYGDRRHIASKRGQNRDILYGTKWRRDHLSPAFCPKIELRLSHVAQDKIIGHLLVKQRKQTNDGQAP
ncbi:hypothetical protein GCM10020258_60110 [Sphingomonas yabuuchiae]